MHASRHAAPQTHRLGRLVTGAPFVGVPSLTVLAAPPLGTSSSSRICADIENGRPAPSVGAVENAGS